MMEQVLNILTKKEVLIKVTGSRHIFSYWCKKFYFFLSKNTMKLIMMILPRAMHKTYF